jgi:hypothetical protein
VRSAANAARFFAPKKWFAASARLCSCAHARVCGSRARSWLPLGDMTVAEATEPGAVLSQRCGGLERLRGLASAALRR